MAQLKVKAYAKINIGLDVRRRLENGYHEVDMIMQTISLYDELLFEPQPQPGIIIAANKEELPVDQNNLIYQAADLLFKEFEIKKGINIKLNKKIPIAAGMAGGSSDAAAVFWAVNHLFDLNLSLTQLQQRAVALGADIPYCLAGGAMRAQGIGEVLSAAPKMPDCFILVAKPAVGVSTKWVYENLHANKLEKHPDIDGMLAAMEQRSLSVLANKMENVLETVTKTKYPVIRQIEEIMEKAGALKAMMSGSGPTVFGIFDKQEQAKKAFDFVKKSSLAPELFLTVPIDSIERN